MFSPYKLIQVEEMEQMEKKHKTEEKKRKAMVEADEKAAKRERRTCFVVGCEKVSRKDGGGKEWRKCEGCGRIFCKLHRDGYAEHIENCSSNNANVTGGNRANT